MKSEKLGENIVLLTFEKQKELALTFFRVQEFYESKNPALKNKYFTPFEFLNTLMNENGEIDYFSVWDGFNVPGNVFKKWFYSVPVNQLSDYESSMFKTICELVDFTKDFYLIGCLEQAKDVLAHEISHALYYTNEDFKIEVTEILKDFQIEQKQEFDLLQETLFNEFEYDYNVLYDETVAWLATSKKREIVNDLGCKWEVVEPYVKRFKKVLRKYNKFQK
jgi:hypothetical protein